MKSDKEMFDEFVELNWKLKNEKDFDAFKFLDIMEYFLYKTLKQIEEDNIDDGFIDELETFSGIAENYEKNKIKEGQYNLSTFFFVLHQLLILKRDNELRDMWAKSFKKDVLLGG